jgi:hypothetical protein
MCHHTAGVVSWITSFTTCGLDLKYTFSRDISVHKEILGPVNEQRREMVSLAVPSVPGLLADTLQR